MTAVIIIMGVFMGIFTATESAAAACLWAFFVTFFIYREVPLSRMWVILKKTLRTLAMVMTVIAASQAFGYMMTTLRVPSMISNYLLTLTSNRVMLLLLINVSLLVLGCIMDMAPLILITAPILLPVVTSPAIGMDPIQFGIVMMLNLSIGLLTPPVGTVLFVGASIGGLPIEKVAKSMVPFYLTMVCVLLLLTFFPALSMTVPNMMFGK
jgi:tripartite ATP-independent transporter DctM subunit